MIKVHTCIRTSAQTYTCSGALRAYHTTHTYLGFHIVREFRDVVFEDVGFEHNSLLTLKKLKLWDYTPKAAMIHMGEGF